MGANWYDTLDDLEMWEKMDAVPYQELWAIRNHLKRKLTFYMQERARLRWIKGALHPVQVIAGGAHARPVRPDVGLRGVLPPINARVGPQPV